MNNGDKIIGGLDEALKHAVNVRDQASRALSMNLAANTDRIISNAVTAVLGHGWEIANLNARLHSIRRAGQSFEVVHLDGQPILELHDPIFSTHYDGEGCKIEVSRNHRYLGDARPPEAEG